MSWLRRKPAPPPEPDDVWLTPPAPLIDHADSVFTQSDPDDPWIYPSGAPRMISESEAHVLATDPDAWQRHRTAQLAALSEPTEEHPLTDTAAPPTTANPDDTGSHHLPETDKRPSCPTCHGTGRQLTTRDYLDEIVGFLPKDAAGKDALIAEFYDRLIKAAPELAAIFPPDLTTGDALNSKGHRQRDMLLSALVDILVVFDPDNPNSIDMQKLRRDAEKWGRDHASFEWPDGSTDGASPDQYITVRNVLYGLLVSAVSQWEDGHTRALVRAYHWVMVIMLKAEQDWIEERQGQLHPRQPRPAPQIGAQR